MSLLGRLRAALRPTPPTSAPTPIREGQEVWGAHRSPSGDGWRLIGRDENPLEGLVSSGPPDIGLGLLGRAAGDVPAVSSSLTEDS